MNRDRVRVAVQAIVAALVVAWISTAVAPIASMWPLLAGRNGSEGLVLYVALVVLGLFDVSLPRGDSIDTSVPVAFAATLRLHPAVTIGVLIAAKVSVLAVKGGARAWGAGIAQVARRSMLVSLTFAVATWFRPDILGALSPATLASELPWIAAAAVLFVSVDALAEQADVSLRTGATWLALVVGTVRLQGAMLAAEMSTAALVAVLLPTIQMWGAMLITVGLLLVMRQSFALLLEVRASYTATVEVLARSLEAYDPDRRGHAERVASLAGRAGRMLGIEGRRLEDITYAALFHDVGRLGSDDASEESKIASARVLDGVGFLSGALPILRVLDSAGAEEASLDEKDLVGAYLIASLSAWDTSAITGAQRSDELADAIGSRLYSSNRRSVDRVIRRVEAESAARNGDPSAEKSR